MSKHCIIKKGKFLIFDKNDNSIEEDQYTINWFKINQLDRDDIDKYANTWLSMKKNNCKYSSTIMNEIKSMEDDMYSVSAKFNHNH